MAKPAVSCDACRGLFAFYAALFESAEDIPDSLLRQWSERAEVLGSETVGSVMEPRARQLVNGNAYYDHASDFLHSLLRDLGRKVQ